MKTVLQEIARDDHRSRPLGRRDRWLASALLLLCALAALIPSPATAAVAGPSPEEIERRVAAALERAGVQTELPLEGEELSAEQPPRPPARDRLPVQAAGGLAYLLQPVLWVLVAVGVVLLAGLLLRQIAGRDRRSAGGEAAASEDGEGRSPGKVVDPAEAEALARRGAYGEAVHALLLAAIGILDRRAPGRLAAALTSREVVAATGLTGTRCSALRELVTAVEGWLFGDAALGEEEYRQGLTAYRRVIGPATAPVAPVPAAPIPAAPISTAPVPAAPISTAPGAGGDR